jgi:hypothetical protein
MTDEEQIARCHNCKQALIEIDNRGELLTGCLTQPQSADVFSGYTLQKSDHISGNFSSSSAH